MLQIFPNPSSGRFFIHHNESKVKDITITSIYQEKDLKPILYYLKNRFQ